MSARPDMITVCTVLRVSRVQFFDMLLCKSAIRRLFFPSCRIVVFCTLSRLFVLFGLDSGFTWRSCGGSCSFAFGAWVVTPACCRATLKWGIRNRKKPMKTRIRNPLIKENYFFKCVKIYCAELLPLKKKTREQVNLKSPQTKIPCRLKFVQPLFLVRVMIIRIEIKCIVNDSALAEHRLQSGYTILWESSSILHTSTSWRNQHLLEAWEINMCSSPLNRDDSLYLPKEYRASTLLDKN